MPESSAVVFVVIGLIAGLLSGILGIGGSVVIVPALIYGAGFTQHRATVTSLAVLLPPIGFAAMWERQFTLDLTGSQGTREFVAALLDM